MCKPVAMIWWFTNPHVGTQPTVPLPDVPSDSRIFFGLRFSEASVALWCWLLGWKNGDGRCLTESVKNTFPKYRFAEAFSMMTCTSSFVRTVWCLQIISSHTIGRLQKRFLASKKKICGLISRFPFSAITTQLSSYFASEWISEPFIQPCSILPC